jgi:DNA-binding MarR family transcriptional regulator
MKTAKSEEDVASVDAFDDLLGYHLRRLSVKVMADFSGALKPLGLNPADASILFVINTNPGITQSDVGKTLGILRANMAPLIAALVQRGFVERETIDGRSQALTLTSSGAATCRQARTAARTHEDRMFGALAETTRLRLIKQIRALWQRDDES